MSRFTVLGLALLTIGATVGCEIEEENIGPATGATSVVAGDCEGNAYEKDMDTGTVEPFELTATADGRDVVLYLDNLEANCCPSPDATYTADGESLLVLFEDVTGADACDCECIMDFEVTLEDVPPADYTLEVEYRGAIIGSAEVTVEA
jgi:hypothetical protein